MTPLLLSVSSGTIVFKYDKNYDAFAVCDSNRGVVVSIILTIFVGLALAADRCDSGNGWLFMIGALRRKARWLPIPGRPADAGPTAGRLDGYPGCAVPSHDLLLTVDSHS